MTDNKPYKVLPVVDATDVGNWQRRKPKWKDLVDQVLQLKPGKSLPVEFETEEEANRARNAVRDWANRILDKENIDGLIRTRLDVVEEGKVVINLIRDYGPSEIKALHEQRLAEKEKKRQNKEST